MTPPADRDDDDNKQRTSGGNNNARQNDEGKVKSKHGFENHFDWMDVVILQISGTKLWTVANQPLVYLSTPDWKRKPTVKEVQNYMKQEAGSSTDIVLKPGDVLYIPRGFVHNASTVPRDMLLDTDDNNEDADNLFDYEEQEPSLHLTFGIEHRCETTVEAVLHFALQMFEEEELAAVGRKHNDNDAQNDVLIMLAVLHYALSAVARFQCPEGDDVDNAAMACRLRESAVLHPAWIEVWDANYHARSTASPNANANANDSMMTIYYEEALQTFASLADLSQTVEFIALIDAGQTSPADRELHQFCIPGKSVSAALVDVIHHLSDDDVRRMLSSKEFDAAVLEFYNVARGRMEEAKDRWAAAR